MKIITRDNFLSLLAEVGSTIKSAGAEGVLMRDLEAVDAYLSAIHCVEGNVAVKNSAEGVRLIWLDTPAKSGQLTFLDE
jgi:hypothetical protein